MPRGIKKNSSCSREAKACASVVWRWWRWQWYGSASKRASERAEDEEEQWKNEKTRTTQEEGLREFRRVCVNSDARNRTTHLWLAQSEPARSHPLDAPYDSVMDEPQPELNLLVHLGNPFCKNLCFFCFCFFFSLANFCQKMKFKI
jgi:hypothetical protein